MHRSPSQRFQRTSNAYTSPPASPRCVSPKYDAIIKQSRQSYLAKNSDSGQIKQEPKEQVDNKIENLQKMLQHEKSKRQVQFNQLYKMINSVKESKSNKNDNQQPSFVYNELEFPMTPRVKSREIEGPNQQRQYNYQTYTPIIETVSKAKEPRHRNYIREPEDYRNPEEYSLKSLQFLLHKIEREAEYNNRNIFRIQQQISSIRSIVSSSKQRSPKVQQIPAQIQKYLKESHNFLKSQIEADRSMLKKLIVQEVQQQVSLKIKQFKQDKSSNGKTQEFDKIYAKMDEMHLFFEQEVKILQEKSENQIYTLNDIVQEKFTFFKDSLLDQVLKYTQEDSSKLSRELEKHKKKINEIEESNAQFFNELEKTMGSIQQKLRLVKQGNLHERQLKDAQLLHNLKQEQDIFFEDISEEFNKKMNTHHQQTLDKIKRLTDQLEKVEDLISPPPKFKVSPEFESQVNDLSKISKITNEHELSFENGNKYIKNEEQQEISQKFNQVMELVSQNCTFLQSRNCMIEESMTEIVIVLNEIVQKLKIIM